MASAEKLIVRFIEARKALILADVVQGLQEYYNCLNDSTFAEELCSCVKVKDTGNLQADYEDARDQLERLAKQNEYKYPDCT